MKNFNKKILIVLSPLATLSFLPIAAFAATAPVTTVQGLVNLICVAFDYMFYALIALSIVMIVIAGFNYVTADGNAETVAKANKMILYSAIGIAVALLARGVPLIVGSFLGTSSGLTTCGGGSSGGYANSTISYGGIVGQ